MSESEDSHSENEMFENEAEDGYDFENEESEEEPEELQDEQIQEGDIDEQNQSDHEKEDDEINRNAQVSLNDMLQDKEKYIKEAQEFRKKQRKKGVIYIPTLPPYMGPHNIRKLLSHLGIERIYCSPETPFKYKSRVKQGGNKKRKYTDAWVEFTSKRKAREIAESYNGQLIGGKKRHNLFRDDVWVMKYLPKFKWENLKEKFEYDARVRKDRMRMQIGQARKEQNFHIEKVEVSKHIERAKLKKGMG